ncbi:mitochondrial single-subunit RNA polymerase, partial [Ochromonadaceae sp. CCMP2298]
DGSCNGLQHYAGLGRDELGAAAVNLVPHDKPQDVYSNVLDKVIEKVARDALIPLDDPNADVGVNARLVQDVVNRKVIKQTVMTSVYGVTRVGARAQIEARLKEKLHSDQNAIISPESEKEIYAAAQYLAGLTLDSLAEMFKSARDIMDWLGQCAKLVSVQERAMSWVTPLGLPVIQPYRKVHLHTVSTVLQTITLTLHADHLPVSGKKQRTAFPPNFVHSMDASHMMMTCMRMKQRNLTFAAVHDSYWTHPSDIPIMNECLREAFVELYEYPVLEELRESLQLRFPEVDFPEIPQRGTLDIKSVKNSTYFFH